jgi:fumarate hydratase class II
MRWLASGPRCAIGELILPENEPGSSIMPGKVNPTQCEAVVMICLQVIGSDTAVAFAGSQGNFELNAMRPIIISNFPHSARILADGCEKFRAYSVEGTELNEKKIAERELADACHRVEPGNWLRQCLKDRTHSPCRRRAR